MGTDAAHASELRTIIDALRSYDGTGQLPPRPPLWQTVEELRKKKIHHGVAESAEKTTKHGEEKS